MDSEVIAGIVGIAALLVMIVLRFPISFALLIVGTGGLIFFYGIAGATSYIPNQLYTYLAKFSFMAVPLFLLMGSFAFEAGLTADAYEVARAWFGRLRGGLGIATVVANAIFGAACGSSLASCAAFSKISIPEMLKSGYSMRLSTGIVAASGGLSVLIPPSIIMIIFGVMTETSIGKLFIAGIFPGLVYAAAIGIGIIPMTARIPRGQQPPPLKERIRSLRKVWGITILALLVIGGIYAGLVTAEEAAALGAFGALLLTLGLRKLNWRVFKGSIGETVYASSMIFLLLAGAAVFSIFMSRSGLMEMATNSIINMHLSLWALLGMLSLLYIILGMFLDSISMMILTLPFVVPIMVEQNIDFLWFGALLCVLVQIGCITPPMGLNIYVMKGVLGDQAKLEDLFLGAAPFVALEIVVVVILIFFPQIATWLPNNMQM